MRKLLSLKPYVFLLGFIGLFLVLIFIWKIVISLLPDIFRPFWFSLVPIGLLGYYFFWIFFIGYGFNELGKISGYKFGIRQFGTLLLIVYLTSSLIFLANIYLILSRQDSMPEYFSVPVALVYGYCLLKIVVKLTKHFRFYDGKDKPKLMDYIISGFILCLPLGILMMHAHLRLILKEKALAR